MAKNVWVIEKLDPDSGADTDWCQWNLGIVEEGFFRTEATFFSEEMALKFKAAVQWLESLEEYNLSMQPPAAIKPKARPKKRSTNEA